MTTDGIDATPLPSSPPLLWPDRSDGHGGTARRRADTTVGYGDIYPVTAAGRVIGGFAMVIGISTFAVITAKVADFLVRGGVPSSDRVEPVETDQQVPGGDAREETLSAEVGRDDRPAGALENATLFSDLENSMTPLSRDNAAEGKWQVKGIRDERRPVSVVDALQLFAAPSIAVGVSIPVVLGVGPLVVGAVAVRFRFLAGP